MNKALRHEQGCKISFLKKKTEKPKKISNKQRNFCVRFLRESKRDYFSQCDHRILSGKINLEIRKSCYFEKTFHKEPISLLSKDKIISKETRLIQTFNSFFNNLAENFQESSEKSMVY